MVSGIESERWAPVVDWEGYEVSSEGRVRSLDRTVHFEDGRVRRYKGQILRQKTCKRTGYVYVSLRNGPRRECIKTDWLVLAAFVGPCPEGQERRHLNGDRADPRLTNLAYGTRVQNMRDKWSHGTAPFGEKHHVAKFSDQWCDQVRAATGTITEIALHFGASRTQVWNVRNSKRRHSAAEILAS